MVSRQGDLPSGLPLSSLPSWTAVTSLQRGGKKAQRFILCPFFLLFQGLSMHPVHNVMDCNHIMERGWKNRSVGSTLMNADSSRSHSIFTIFMEMSSNDEAGEEHIRAGKLNLVDLAGSERQAKTGELM